MSRLDRLVVRELVGPFALGVGLFSTLVFASVMLTRITEWIVQGIAPTLVMRLTFLFTPAILVKSASMAGLLAALLAFGRLSNDSEIVAMRSTGVSLFRVMRPVFLFSFAIAAIVFATNETVVPWASEQANALQIEVKRSADAIRGQKNINRTERMKDGTTLMLNAIDFSLTNQTLTNASIVVFNQDLKPVWWIQAEEMRWYGERDWRLSGEARMISGDGIQVVNLRNGAWPSQVENPDITPRNLFAGFMTDLDSFSMGQTKEEIDRLRRDVKPDQKQIANLEFGYWNKIALPLSTVIFALLGAPLGVRHQRAGMGAGFALSIALTFGYLMLANFLAVYSKGGAIPPFAASFAPVLIGGIAAAFAIWHKNR